VLLASCPPMRRYYALVLMASLPAQALVGVVTQYLQAQMILCVL
jgi:hypothetical protein